jgi:hypothetical protein
LFSFRHAAQKIVVFGLCGSLVLVIVWVIFCEFFEMHWIWCSWNSGSNASNLLLLLTNLMLYSLAMHWKVFFDAQIRFRAVSSDTLRGDLETFQIQNFLGSFFLYFTAWNTASARPITSKSTFRHPRLLHWVRAFNSTHHIERVESLLMSLILSLNATWTWPCPNTPKWWNRLSS